MARSGISGIQFFSTVENQWKLPASLLNRKSFSSMAMVVKSYAAFGKFTILFLWLKGEAVELAELTVQTLAVSGFAIWRLTQARHSQARPTLSLTRSLPQAKPS